GATRTDRLGAKPGAITAYPASAYPDALGRDAPGDPCRRFRRLARPAGGAPDRTLSARTSNGEMGRVSRPSVSVSVFKRLVEVAKEAFEDVSLERSLAIHDLLREWRHIEVSARAEQAG